MRINRCVFELILEREKCFEYWWWTIWFLFLSFDVMLIWCFLDDSDLIYCLMIMLIRLTTVFAIRFSILHRLLILISLFWRLSLQFVFRWVDTSTFAIDIFLKVLYNIRASYVFYLFLLTRWIESSLVVQSDFEKKDDVLDLRIEFEILFIE